MRVLVMVLFIFMLSLSLPATIEASWQEEMHQWAHLVQEREHISIITGGDLTGNLYQDVVIVFDGEVEESMIALINTAGDYKRVSFDALSGDFLTGHDFSLIEDMQIVNGEIFAYLPFDIGRLVSSLSGTHSTLLMFRYLEDSLRLTNLVSTGMVSYMSRLPLAHVFYDALKGEVYYRYLAEEERVGVSRSYYFNRYSRVIASPLLREFPVNASRDKWLLVARSHRLENSPIGNPITYGFERWVDHRDLSATYYIGYHESSTYIFVDVEDSVVRQNLTGDQALRGDHVELWFGDEEGNRYQIALLPGNFKDTEPESMLWYYENRAVTGTPLDTVSVASRLTSRGYSIEARIPLSVMGKQSFHEIHRFTLAVSDSDEADRQEKLLTSSSLVWGEAWSLGEIIWREKGREFF